MNNFPPSRIRRIALGVTAGTIVLFLGLYGLTRAMSSGEVMGRVEVAETAIGGLDPEQALGALLAVEDGYLNRPAIFQIDNKVVSVLPPEAGFEVDEQGIVDLAMTVGREGNPFSQFWWWLTHIFSTTHIHPIGSLDRDAINAVFDTWDGEVIDEPAVQGGVDLVDGELVPSYPKTGIGVDRPAAARVVLDSMLADTQRQETIPTVVVEPELADADVDEAMTEAQELLSDDIELVQNGTSAVFTVDQLREAFRSETVLDGLPRVVNSFDPEVIDSFLAPIRTDFEAEPVDARFEIDGDQITIVPGQPGTKIDAEETARRLASAGLTTGRIGQLPVVEGAEPEITTDYLQSLGIKQLVSQFTTYHDCCENRVVNIHNIADEVDMAIIMPGDSFSLNGYVGERTAEDGYLPAGTIIGGEFEDTVGGGVSQFATTLYNAIFWAGLEDVEHKPHSYYFSRYPEGIEATVNWRTPDLEFRNDTDHAILLDTQYTDTSITVRVFGDNDGRTVKGEQKGGERHMEVTAEGGPNALHVDATVSDRYAFTNPPSPKYVANPDLDPDQQKQTQSEAGGWSVKVTRTITRGGADLVKQEEWVVRYAPKFAVYEVNPCMMPDTEEACPTTTTTTTTLPTTTTTPAPSTTGG